jgi:hypothetical protein
MRGAEGVLGLRVGRRLAASTPLLAAMSISPRLVVHMGVVFFIISMLSIMSMLFIISMTWRWHVAPWNFWSGVMSASPRLVLDIMVAAFFIMSMLVGAVMS